MIFPTQMLQEEADVFELSQGKEILLVTKSPTAGLTPKLLCSRLLPFQETEMHLPYFNLLSLLGDIRKLSGHGPGQPDLGVPA